MADSQPPGPTNERTTSSPGSTVLKRSFSQLAMEYEDDRSPTSSSSTQATGSPTRRASDQGVGGSSNSPRQSDADSHDRQDRNKRARSASFESSRENEPSMTLAGVAGPSDATATSNNTGNISDSSSDSWMAVQASGAPGRSDQDASAQHSPFEENIALLRASSRNSPPRRAFVHRHSQRRPRLFARELSPSSQEENRGASHGERASRPPSEVIMISDTESDDQPSQSNAQDSLAAILAAVDTNTAEANPQTTNPSNERQVDRVDLPSFATLFPEHRSADASTSLLNNSSEVVPESEELSTSGPTETSPAGGTTASVSSNGTLSHSQENHLMNYPPGFGWSLYGTVQSSHDADPVSSLFDGVSSFYPYPPARRVPTLEPERRHDNSNTRSSLRVRWGMPSSFQRSSSSRPAVGETTPSENQGNRQGESGSRPLQSTASLPLRPSTPPPPSVTQLGGLDHSIDPEAVTSQPSDQLVPSVSSTTNRQQSALEQFATRLRRLHEPTEGRSTPHTRRQSLRASADSGASTESVALRHARLIEERERQRTLSLPSAATSPSSSSPSASSSSSSHQRSATSGSLRRQPSGRRVGNMLRSILLDRMAEREGPSSARSSNSLVELSEADRQLDRRMDEVLDLYTDQANRRRAGRHGHGDASSPQPSRRSRARGLASQDVPTPTLDQSLSSLSTMDSQAEDGPSPSFRDAHAQLESLVHQQLESGTSRNEVPSLATMSPTVFGETPDASQGLDAFLSTDSAEWSDWFTDPPSLGGPSTGLSSGRASTPAAARSSSSTREPPSLVPARQTSGPNPPFALTDWASSGEPRLASHPLTRTSDVASSSSSFSSYATANTSPSSPTATSLQHPLEPPVPPSSFTYGPFQFGTASPSHAAAPPAAESAHAQATSSSQTQAPPTAPISTISAPSRNQSPAQALPTSRSQPQPPMPQLEPLASVLPPDLQEPWSVALNLSVPLQPPTTAPTPAPRAPTNLESSSSIFSQPPRPPTASQPAAFPSRPPSAANSVPPQGVNRPGSTVRSYNEPFSQMPNVPEERTDGNASDRPSSVRPTRSHRPEVTARQRSALEQVNALDGSLLALLAAPESSDATIDAASRAMSVINQLRRNIQLDMIDGPGRREDSSSSAATSPAGASRMTASSSNQGASSSQRSNSAATIYREYRRRMDPINLSLGVAEDDSFDASQGTGHWSRIFREAEERLTRATSSLLGSTDTTSGGPSAQESTGAPNIAVQLPPQVFEPVSDSSNNQRRGWIEQRPVEIGSNSAPTLPSTSTRRAMPYTPFFDHDSHINVRRVPDDPPADDRWARERRRRHELENELLDETRLLQERPAQSSSRRLTGRTFEIPVVDPRTMQQVGTSSFELPTFTPSRASSALMPTRSESASGNRSSERRQTTSVASVAGDSRSENTSTGTPIAPDASTTDRPTWGRPTPPRPTIHPSWQSWSPARTSSQSGPGLSNSESAMVDSRMDVDSDEEVSLLFQDSDSMVVDSAARQDTSTGATARNREVSAVDHAVAQSHERRRAQSSSATNTSTSARPAAARREINLDAYHDGPFRAALARTVANQRRRAELELARERLRLGIPLGNRATSPTLFAGSIPPAPVSQDNPLGASGSAPRSADPPRSSSSANAVPSSTSNPRLDASVTSTGLMDEDDEDTAEILRLLAEPVGRGSARWVHPLRRTDSENWNTDTWSPGAARERMYQEAVERRGTMWLASPSGGPEPSRRDNSLEFDEHYRHLLHAIRDDVRPSGRGTSEAAINSLPSGTYGEWSTPGESEERCPICFEDYEQSEPVLRLPACSHWFHKPCLIQWLKTARTCPMCRTAVEPERDRPIFGFTRGSRHHLAGRMSNTIGSSGRASNGRVRTIRPPAATSSQGETERRDGAPPAGGPATRRRIGVYVSPSVDRAPAAGTSQAATFRFVANTAFEASPAGGPTPTGGTTTSTGAVGARRVNRRNRNNGPPDDGSSSWSWADWNNPGDDDE